MKIKKGSLIRVACQEGDYVSKITAIYVDDRTVDVDILDADTGEPTGETLESVPFSALRKFEGVGPAEVDPPAPPPAQVQTPPQPGTTRRRDLGFNQYRITWTGHNFKFSTTEPAADFYGQWRRTIFQPSRIPGYAIDMWVHFSGRDFVVESVYYHEDPRLDARSLEGDLCAMANKFLFGRLSGNLDRIEDLVKRAENPSVKITSLKILDELLLKLREVRETAITCGGQRYFTFPKDPSDESSATVTLHINVTREAMLYSNEGSRPPAADYGKSYFSEDGERSKIEVSKETVAALVKQLRATTDPTTARRLRTMLRRLGHTGGARHLPEGFDD